MQYGICPLSIVPIRTIPDDAAEMSSQLLYGEHFKVLEQRKKWCKIRAAHDSFEGWVANNQIILVSEDTYLQLDSVESKKISSDIISHICTEDGMLLPILLGSMVSCPSLLNHVFEGGYINGQKAKSNLVDTA